MMLYIKAQKKLVSVFLEKEHIIKTPKSEPIYTR